jgi:hypothetical protein
MSLPSSVDATCFHVGFFLGLFFDPEDGGDIHGVISQRIVLFMASFL